MKFKDLTKNISIFILAVLIIAVYKTFDSIGIVFGYIGRFFRLLIPVFIAFAIAFLLHPVCKKIESLLRKLKIKFLAKHCRGFAVAAVYLIALLAVSGVFSILLPMLFKSITDFVQQLPSIIENAGKFLYSLEFGGYSVRPVLDKITIQEVMNKFNLTDIQMYMDSLAGFSKGIVNIFLAIIISVYILLDRGGFLITARKLTDLIIPEKGKAIFIKYVQRTFNIMYKYVYCQLLEVCIVSAMAFLALIILRVNYAPILALLIGVANLIPYFGAVIACAFTALLTVFTSSLSKGIVVAIVLIVLQQIDANIIQPKLVRDTLKVKPFWVLCGVSVGSGLFGMIGILLAVPVMALIKTIFEDCYDYYLSSKKERENDPQTITKPQTEE
ncbi:MAG: AI-2E family transporter [Clostridia bacterium]|nr:AI-2E family transporter [Clostridia bacterium]